MPGTDGGLVLLSADGEMETANHSAHFKHITILTKNTESHESTFRKATHRNRPSQSLDGKISQFAALALQRGRQPSRLVAPPGPSLLAVLDFGIERGVSGPSVDALH